MNWLYGTVAAVLLAPPGLWPQEGPVSLKLRTTAKRFVFECEFGNRSSEVVDAALPLRFILLPKEPTGERRDRRSELWSTVDPRTGRFAPEGSSVRLRLEPGESRSVLVDLRELMWSLGPRSTRTPGELYELLESGPYQLSISILGGSPPMAWYVEPLTVDLESEEGAAELGDEADALSLSNASHLIAGVGRTPGHCSKADNRSQSQDR